MRRLLVLGGLLCTLAVAAGCHKKTPSPDPYLAATMIDEERAIVNEVVPDSARRADIMAILDQAESRMRQLSASAQPLSDSLHALLISWNATENQIKGSHQAIAEVRHRQVDVIVRYHFEMRELMFPNEWAAIADRDARAVVN